MSYLDDVWYCGALSQELSVAPLGRVICGRPVVIFRTESGRVAALEDRCAHRQAPLSLGEVIGEDLQCRYHGFLFDCSGTCVHIPRQDVVPPAARVASYPVIERWGYVWLWLGPPERADRKKLPDMPWTEDTGLRTVYFHFHVQANFQLMADNLLDVSHTDFLHKQSIGSQTSYKAESATPLVELDCRVDGDRVYFTRRVRDTLLGPIATKWAGTSKAVDRTNVLMWEAPNTVHSVLEFKNAERCATIRMEHIMTPESTDTMHYFMNWTRDFGLDNVSYPTDEDVAKEQTAVVTGDDIPMVEAQQVNLRRFPGTVDIASRQDRFITSVHRVLRRLYTENGKPPPPELDRGRAAPGTSTQVPTP